MPKTTVLGTRVVPRESQQQSSPLSYHPHTHHFLAPSRLASLYPTHNPPCLSPLDAPEREGHCLRRLSPVQRRASTPVGCQNKASNICNSRDGDDNVARWRCNHVVVESLGQTVRTEMQGKSECVARASARLAYAYTYARWIMYARSPMHDALTATRPTMPRTVIGAGESESVPVAADSVVHKRGGRRHLSPSLPGRSPLSLGPSRPLFPVYTSSL